MELALRQHRGYVATLRHVGLEVTELPADDDHPDAVFVQDRACVVDGRAIVGPSAVASRGGRLRLRNGNDVESSRPCEGFKSSYGQKLAIAEVGAPAQEMKKTGRQRNAFHAAPRAKNLA